MDAPFVAPVLLALFLGALVFVVLLRRPRERQLSQRGLLLAVLILILLVGIGAAVFTFLQPEDQQIPYSGSAGSFLGLVKAGKVPRVVQQGARLTITHDLGGGRTEILVSQVPSELINLREEIVAACAEPGAVPDCVSRVAISAEEPSQTGQVLTLLLTALLPVILIGAIFFFMLRQARAQGGAGWGRPVRRLTRERLEELEALRAKGLVTEDEYAAKRKEILEEL